MNYAVKLKSLNATKKTYEESNSRSKLTSLSHGNYSSRNRMFITKELVQEFWGMKKSR